MSTEPKPINRVGVLKQVNSGDSIVVKSCKTSKEEMTVVLSGIEAPKLAWQGSKDRPEDQPYAWEAREFLRKKLQDKDLYCETRKIKEIYYGTVYIGKDSSGENICETLVKEGLVAVRATGKPPEMQRLRELEDIARAAGKGKHGPNPQSHIRKIVWSVENLHNFKDSFHNKPIKAIVEKVKDGSTLRLVLLPDVLPEYYYINVMLSGIRCPSNQADKVEKFGEEAQRFTERHLLQRDVSVILESVNQNSFLGTVLHPNGNIAKVLLSYGLAKCVDWSMHLTTGLEELRAAEKLAKEKRYGIWEDYTPKGTVIDAKEKEFQGKVVEIINADAMNIKLADGRITKIFLAGVRPPRLTEGQADPSKTRMRPLYEIPGMFEAREFLRKKLIGKKVNVTIDYKQPANNNFPEKICCTVTIGGVNIAEVLVGKGLATVVRYRQNDDDRPSQYDKLLAAENKAQKSGKTTTKEKSIVRVVDLSGDLQKSKFFFKKGVKMEAIVEFIASGSRFRIYVPREHYLVSFLLAGISCPRASAKTKVGDQPGDPFGDEAHAFTKDLCLQREVQVEVESMDKAGNYIGFLWIDNLNMSEALLRAGLAEIHSTAAKSAYYKALLSAQEEAQSQKRKIWELHEPVKEIVEEVRERVEDYKRVIVTEIRPDLSFFVQYNDEGQKLEDAMHNLRQELSTNPPLPGSYTPKRGDIFAAQFSEDKQWYRAKIDKVLSNELQIIFIDYGNKEVTTSTSLAPLPSAYHSLPPYAHECVLAFVKPPADEADLKEARMTFFDEIDNKILSLNVEYKVGSTLYVTLHTSEDNEDIGKGLISKGVVFAEKRKEKRYQKIISEYNSAQDSAKMSRKALWIYGDVTEDDAKEFG